jgi:Leucine-rich repeat (LRR) protein
MKKANYVYKNNSGIDLSIEVYDSDNVMFKNYELPNSQEIEISLHPTESPSPFYIDENGNTTVGIYIIVKFSDYKCLYFDRNSGVDIYGDEIFDIRKYDNYSTELVEQSEFTLYYTFTQEDYGNSVNCN